MSVVLSESLGQQRALTPPGSPTPSSPTNHGAMENNYTETISIDEAIDRIGNGKFQQQLMFATGTSFMADSMEIMLLSFLTLVLKDEWQWEGLEVPIITSSVFAGAMVGTICLGNLGDKIGRRPVLFCASFIITFFGVVSALCQSFVPLLLVRFMVGFGIGGLTVPFDILAEFLPTENRGRYLLLIEYYWTAGSILVPITAFITLEMLHSWRLFVVVCSIPCLISLITSMRYIPESPRWLIMQGRNGDAIEILRNAALVNGIDPLQVFPSGCVIRCQEVESHDFIEILKPKWRRLTCLLWSLWIGMAFSYYGTIIAVTRIFRYKNGDNDNDDGGKDNDNDAVSFDYSALLISSLAEIVGTMLVISLVDRVGRIPTQVCSYGIGGSSLLILCLFSAFDMNRALLVVVAFICRVCEMAGSCVTWISTAEILPTEIRSTGHSAANAFARIGGFCAPFLIDGDISLIKIGVLMLIIHLTTAFCAYKLPETKDRNLGEVLNGEEGGAENLDDSDSTGYTDSHDDGTSLVLI